MPKNRQAHAEDKWRNAKKICGLNARQVEMARRLGMNPKKLPGLRPNPQERWKLPVGAFIEESYRKRFGGEAEDADPHLPQPRTNTRPPAQRKAVAPKGLGTAESRLSDLVCYLVNLADDVEKWRAYGTVDRDIITQISVELRDVAQALDSGAQIPPLPAIPLPPRPAHGVHSRHDRVQPHSDDEIPF